MTPPRLLAPLTLILGSVCSAQTVFNAPPPTGGDDVASINGAIAQIAAAYNAAPNSWTGAQLVFSGGTYELHRTAGAAPLADTPLIVIEDIPHLEILATSALNFELVGFDRTVGDFNNVISVRNCHQFTLAGASASQPIVFDMRPTASPPGNEGLNYLQGEIVSINGAQVKLRMTDPEYFLPATTAMETAFENTLKIWAWELTAGRAPHNAVYQPSGTLGVLNAQIDPISGNTQCITLEFATGGSWLPNSQNWTLGAQAVVVLGETQHGLIRNTGRNTGQLTLRNITIHHYPGKAMMWSYTEDVLAENVNVTPRVGDLSTSRDGWSIWGAYGDIALDGCSFVQTGDDAINFRCEPLGDLAFGLPGIAAYTPIDNKLANFKLGETIEWRDDTMDAASAVQGIASADAIPLVGGRAVTWFPNPALDAVAMTNSGYLFNYSSVNDSMSFTQCHFQGTRGVGIHATGPNITVADCKFANSMLASIHLGAGLTSQYPFNNQIYPSDDVKIRDCAFEAVNIDELPRMYSAAIFVGSAMDELAGGPSNEWVFSPSTNVQSNIHVHACTFTNLNRSAIAVINCDSIALTDNVLNSVGGTPNPSFWLWNTWQDGILVHRCQNGVVSNTTAINVPGVPVNVMQSTGIVVQ